MLIQHLLQTTLKLGLFACLLAGSQPAVAQISADCERYLSGRSVRFVVATGAGGGFDRSARALARAFANTSNARTQVANITGGNGYLAVRAVSNAGDNAINIGLLTKERIVSPLANTAGVSLDDFHVLGIISSEQVAWITRKDFQPDKDLRIPVASFDYHEAAIRWGLPARALDLSIASVLGHAGSAESSSALARGDVDMGVYSISRVKRLLQQGDFTVSLVLSNGPHEDFPDVPYLAGDGGLVDQQSTADSAELRQQRMATGELASRFATSMRTLFVSSRISPATHQCLTETIDSILGSTELAQEMDALGQEFAPLGSARARQQIELDALLLRQNQELLETVLEEVMH